MLFVYWSGNQQESTFIDNLQEQEIVLKQCIEQLEIAKATRATLITQLMEAIKEQVLFFTHAN